MNELSTRTRRCTGCRHDLPETVENFYRSPSGAYAACCRKCRSGQRSEQATRRTGNDGMRKTVSDTRHAVARAFRRIDPGGTEQNELMSRLSRLVSRFRGIRYDERAKAVGYFATEILRPEN